MRHPVAWRLILAAAAAKLAAHLATGWHYGFQRDELYYLDTARHLAWGYVDFPPVTPFLAFLDQLLFPGSLLGLRLVPALGGAGIVVLAGLIARELGGGRFAQALAALVALAAPIFLGANVLFQTVTIDQLVWALVCYLLVRLLATGDRRLWLPLGVAFGVGLETKYQVAMLGLGVGLGLLLTRERRQLLTAWPWVAVAIALVLFAPNVVWQAQRPRSTRWSTRQARWGSPICCRRCGRAGWRWRCSARCCCCRWGSRSCPPRRSARAGSGRRARTTPTCSAGRPWPTRWPRSTPRCRPTSGGRR